MSAFLLNSTKFKFLKSGLVNAKGVNNNGSKVARWKGGSSTKNSIISIDFCRISTSTNALVLNLVKAYRRSCLVAFIKYSSGSYAYVLSPYGLQAGFFVKTLFKPFNFSLAYGLGYMLLLKYLTPNTIVFNIEITLYKGGEYCKAAGTFGEILVIDDFVDLVLIKLPTGAKIWVHSYCCAVLGRASNIFNHNSVVGKAGLNRNINIKSIVRGVAMNAVDHPHGGRSKTNSPEMTPWNKIAKKNR